MRKRYRVIIVGSGPSGIFAALTLSRAGVEDMAIFERGKDIHDRERGRGMELLCGWGGAGAFSDGKLTLSPTVGGFLSDFIPQNELMNLIKKADESYLLFGAPPEVLGQFSDKTEALYQEAKLAGLEYIPMEIRHLGTERGESGEIPASTSVDLVPSLPSLTYQIKSKNMKIEDRMNYLKHLINVSTISKKVLKDAL